MSTVDRPTILIVDDVSDNLVLMSELLRDHYRIRLANSGEKALAILRTSPRPDLILLDIVMPEMDGYEVCRRLKADVVSQNIPVIFLTANTSAEDEERGFALGAVDYITKPFGSPVVLARIKTHLQLKQAADFLIDQNRFLSAEISRRVAEMTDIQDVTIWVMTSMAETRDSDTGNHIRRTQLYVRELAKNLQDHPRFAGLLDDDQIDMLYKSAPLHDIGKVGIPDRILLKPNKLTPDEFEIMKTHTTRGYQAITQAEQALGRPVEFLAVSKEIALFHHEKWDGSGYPQGLSGDDIPLSARLMAVADVYDALISQRVYKPGMSHDSAVLTIVEGRGSHFDPDLVDALIACKDRFKDIASQYADKESDWQDKLDYLDSSLGELP